MAGGYAENLNQSHVGPDELNALSKYYSAESRNAQELLQLQMRHAKELADFRIKLMQDLNNEALAEGKHLEEYLAEYGLNQRLKLLDIEHRTREAVENGNIKALQRARQNSDRFLHRAEEAFQKSREEWEHKLAAQKLLANNNLAAQLTRLNEAELKAVLEKSGLEKSTQLQLIDQINTYRKQTTENLEAEAIATRLEAELGIIEESRESRLAMVEELTDTELEAGETISDALETRAEAVSQTLRDLIDEVEGLDLDTEFENKTNKDFEKLTGSRDMTLVDAEARKTGSADFLKDLKAGRDAEDRNRAAAYNTAFKQLFEEGAIGGENSKVSLDELADSTTAEDHRAKAATLTAERDQKIAEATDNDARAEIEAEYALRIEKENEIAERKESLEKRVHKNMEVLKRKSEKEEEDRKRKSSKELFNNNRKWMLGLTEEEREEASAELGVDGEELDKRLAQGRFDAAVEAISNFGDQLIQTGESIAKSQSAIDTRLQGSKDNASLLGSYWGLMSSKISMGVGMSMTVRQEDVVSNLKTLVGKGIAYNVSQRAFLQTISEKIATTFEAADGTLLKLVRIQQADSTAVRLGMESALTEFLNSMYETTEYMSEAAASIRGSIYEASALMMAEDAVEFEYQVQKWMGSLYSVGFSSTEGLATAFGKLAAGDISGITDGGHGNLLVMAAQQAGLSLGDILAEGIDDSDTNKLFAAMVEYLAGIYEGTNGSKVLAQQFANIYGLTASDLKAAASLSTSVKDISKTNETTSTLLGQLETMANTMILRTSTGEWIENLTDNLMYTMSATMGNNPILSMTYKMAGMLDDLANGGFEMPFLNVYGFGLDLNASVADLMKIASVGGTVLGSLGKMVAGLAGGIGGSAMLRKFGVDTSGIDQLSRGTASGSAPTKSGDTVSESGYVGNESSQDVQDKTMNDAAAEPEKQVAEAKEEEDNKEETRHQEIVSNILQIYELLQDFAVGTKQMHVKLSVGDVPSSWTTGTWTR